MLKLYHARGEMNSDLHVLFSKNDVNFRLRRPVPGDFKVIFPRFIYSMISSGQKVV